MKHIITLLIALCLSSFAHAQNYKPFPDSVAVWVEEFTQGVYDQPSGYGATIIQCDIYVMQGDTLLADSNEWNKIWLYNTQLDTLPESYFGAIREDSLKRVWIWMAADTIPFVLYDYSLHLGDTFHLTIPNIVPIAAKVVTADSITGRIDIVFDTIIFPDFYVDTIAQVCIPGWTLTWWQGEGSWKGLIYFLNYTSGRTTAIDKRRVYFNDTSTLLPSMSCTDYASIDNATQGVNLSIYPVPVFESLSVVSSDFVEKIHVYALSGEVLQRYDIGAYSASVDVSELPAGVYVLRAECRNGTAYSKVIKL